MNGASHILRKLMANAIPRPTQWVPGHARLSFQLRLSSPTKKSGPIDPNMPVLGRQHQL